MRTLGNGAYILPSDSPLQRYFQSKLEALLAEIVKSYVKGGAQASAGELQGYLPGANRVEWQTPPWQEDYLVIVLGWINSMGFRDAQAILEWMTNFTAGRFTSAERGYDPFYGAPYELTIADPHSRVLVNTWADAFNRSFADEKPPEVKALDQWAGGYAALARASLASIISATHSPRAKQAYAFVEKHTPKMEDSYPVMPNFAIAPTVQDQQ
jgi:hypothetical protein